MAEKGVKRFQVPIPKKAVASKSTAKKSLPMKGKDDSSKAKMNVHLQLSDSEDSAEENFQMPSKVGAKSKGSFGTPTSTGDSGKGGKGDKTGKAASKNSMTREPIVKVVADAELKIEEDLPKNAKCLMDSEAAVILQGVEQSLSLLSADPSIKIPEPFFKGLEYAKTGSHYKSPQSAREALSALKANKATDGQICMIGNICPEMVDEVYAFVPSLKSRKNKNEEAIKEALYNLAKHKQSK